MANPVCEAYAAGRQYARDYLADHPSENRKQVRMHFINVASDLEPEEPDMAFEGMLSALREEFLKLM